MSITIDNHPAGFSAGRMIREFAQRQLARLHRRNRVREARRHLGALPDYLLKDIGISRSDIASVTEFGLGDPTRRQRG